MKRSTASIINGKDIDSFQSKRIRSSTPVRQEQEEMIDHMNENSPPSFSSQKKVLKIRPENFEETTFNGKTNHHDNSIITTHTPTRSSISLTSTSSKGPSTSSKGLSSSTSSKGLSSSTSSKGLSSSTSSKGLSSSTSSKGLSSSTKDQPSLSQYISSSSNLNQNKHKFSTPSQVPDKSLQKKRDTINAPTRLENNPLKKVLSKQNNKPGVLTTTSTNNFSRTADSYSKVSSPLSNNKNQTQTAPSSSNDTDSSNNNSLPMHALIEGSLEFREMKRLYLFEQQQSEDWRKDYKVLKRQLAHVKSTTIPRPTAEVLDWLHELFDLMNNQGVFRGDGRSLKTIAKALKINENSLITVAARTPQKSALKLFRILYSTISSRAALVSISMVPAQQLENIYAYVRTLHKTLNFNKNEMRKAIGTCIRSATSELRKLERYRQRNSNVLQNDENINSDEGNETMDDTGDMDTFLDGPNDITHDDENREDIDDDEDKEEGDDGEDEESDVEEDEDEDADKEENNLIVDEELNEDDD